MVMDTPEAVDQSHHTGPSDQSDQSRLAKRRGLERESSNEAFQTI